MQKYATWASSSSIFFKDRDIGTIMLLHSLIMCRYKREEEQHSTEPNIVNPQLETAFINSRWPHKHQVLTIGPLQCPSFEGPAQDTLLPRVSFVSNEKCGEHPKMSLILCRWQHLQCVQKSSYLHICNIYKICVICKICQICINIELQDLWRTQETMN